MQRILLAGVMSLFLFAEGAQADPVRVVASIKPVHSLVSMVLDGIAEPYLIVQGAASPHGHAMRPSDAQALADADAVFWIGPGMETFLEKPLHALSAKAAVVALMDDDEAEGGHKHPPAKSTDGQDHGEHDHGGTDPHVWLDPGHAAEMIDRIAETMTQLLPAHAALLAANRDKAVAVITQTEADIRRTVTPYKHENVVVLHDAYGHFTRHFGLSNFIALSVTPEHRPGPGKIRDVRHEIAAHGVRCVFAEPQFPDTYIKLLVEDSGARAATLDPLGADLTPGAALYPKLLLGLAASFRDCLAGTS